MRNRILPIALALLGLGVAIAAPAAGAAPASAKVDSPVKVQVFAPRPGDAAGEASKGFVIDLAAQYPSLASSGADLQLTGPAAHQNQGPFPGAFSPGADDRLPGLIVLLSTGTVGARNAQNLANFFNLTGITDRKRSATRSCARATRCSKRFWACTARACRWCCGIAG